MVHKYCINEFMLLCVCIYTCYTESPVSQYLNVRSLCSAAETALSVVRRRQEVSGGMDKASLQSGLAQEPHLQAPAVHLCEAASSQPK